MATDVRHILTINSGSSSLKLAVFSSGPDLRQIWSGNVDRIGAADSEMRVRDAEGRSLAARRAEVASQGEAMKLLLTSFRTNGAIPHIDAVGHRLVHGGRAYSQPCEVNDAVLADLQRLIPLAPTHLPTELDAITHLRQEYPQTPQVACFDTAFHRTLPIVAQLFGLPRRLYDEGILRYGFHGLSYEYVLQELVRSVGADAAHKRLILAHLGNGASMAAVRDGRSLDTTMGLTPLGGLVMGTRSGDLDPGVLLYLLRQQQMNSEQLEASVNKQGGLLGVSERSPDMRELLAIEASDEHAAQAIALFCHSARKSIGALAAVLGGVDMLVFTGGIGENAAEIRHRICHGLEFIGISIDEAHNGAHAPIISSESSRVTVRVIKTNEDAMIAQHTYNLFWGER
ncbi:MAG TPA: acetate/propionate family kinase [Ktedonobacterales bacterium]|jgi:acetate kinase|nr:acetate/propionate family kinase [Ktedonobacterales bacterium]